MPRSKIANQQGATRINLKLSTRAIERINRAREIVDATSNAEAVRMAVQFFVFMLEALKKGDQICLKKPDGKIEVMTFPSLTLLANEAGDEK